MISAMLYIGPMDQDAMAMPENKGADLQSGVIAATAVSRKRTVLAEVNDNGYVSGVRLLAAAARTWDADTLELRIKAVAAVAHDRYLAGLPATHAVYPTLDDVADAESGLDF